MAGFGNGVERQAVRPLTQQVIEDAELVNEALVPWSEHGSRRSRLALPPSEKDFAEIGVIKDYEVQQRPRLSKSEHLQIVTLSVCGRLHGVDVFPVNVRAENHRRHGAIRIGAMQKRGECVLHTPVAFRHMHMKFRADMCIPKRDEPAFVCLG